MLSAPPPHCRALQPFETVSHWRLPFHRARRPHGPRYVVLEWVRGVFGQTVRERSGRVFGKRSGWVSVDRRSSRGGAGESRRYALGQRLEIRVLAVMACNEDILPCDSHMADVADEVEPYDICENNRRLLCVLCTRTRERLPVTAI